MDLRVKEWAANPAPGQEFLSPWRNRQAPRKQKTHRPERCRTFQKRGGLTRHNLEDRVESPGQRP